LRWKNWNRGFAAIGSRRNGITNGFRNEKGASDAPDATDQTVFVERGKIE
jgi:hypothetical protein